MATINIQLPRSEYASLQVGDILYSGTLDIPDSMSPPTTSSYLLFKKDVTVNTTSLLGYYGSAKFINNSTDKVELFATACEINESSK
jgi:hypothetical protein